MPVRLEADCETDCDADCEALVLVALLLLRDLLSLPEDEEEDDPEPDSDSLPLPLPLLLPLLLPLPLLPPLLPLPLLLVLLPPDFFEPDSESEPEAAALFSTPTSVPEGAAVPSEAEVRAAEDRRRLLAGAGRLDSVSEEAMEMETEPLSVPSSAAESSRRL